MGRLRGFNEELRSYDCVIDRLEGTADVELNTTLAMALIKKGIVLGWMGHTDAEMAQFERVVQRFGAETTIELQAQVAMALLCKADSLNSVERTDDAIQVYDEIIRRFHAISDPGVARWVDGARESRAQALANTSS